MKNYFPKLGFVSFFSFFLSLLLLGCQKSIPLETYLQKDELALLQNYSGQVAVLQNMTSESETALSYLKKKNAEIRPQIQLQSEPYTNFELKTKSINAEYEVVQVQIKGLSPEKKYVLQLLNTKNEILDSRIFTSLQNSKADYKIAVASCARVGWIGGDHAKPSIWDELFSKNPDALIFLGDFVYPDSVIQALFHIQPSLEQIQEKYIETWQEVKLYHQPKLVPVFSILDDHDYGFQGANRLNNAEKMDLVKDFFRSFYPLLTNSKSLIEGPGAAFATQLMGFQLILLDNKYYRIAQAEAEREGPIWGEAQLQWLRTQLDLSSQPSLIGSGTLITFPVHNPDAAMYESPEEFHRFAETLKGAKSKAVIMTGDVHYSSVSQIHSQHFGYDTYEVTASRIHSISPLIVPPYISGKIDSADQLIHSAEKNFVLLEGKNGLLQNIKMSIFNKNEEKPIFTTLF